MRCLLSPASQRHGLAHFLTWPAAGALPHLPAQVLSALHHRRERSRRPNARSEDLRRQSQSQTDGVSGPSSRRLKLRLRIRRPVSAHFAQHLLRRLHALSFGIAQNPGSALLHTAHQSAAPCALHLLWEAQDARARLATLSRSLNCAPASNFRPPRGPVAASSGPKKNAKPDDFS